MSGYEAAGLLRRQGYARRTIALTLRAVPGDRDMCAAAGCDEYTAKPIQRQVTIETISTYARCARSFGDTHGRAVASSRETAGCVSPRAQEASR